MCIETVNSLRMEKGGKGKNRTIRNKASDIGCERPVIGKGHFHGLMRKEECVETVAGAAAETDGWSLVCGLTAQRKGMVITMKNATKKWLIVAGGLAACAALVFIIAGQFEKKPVNDTLPPPSSSSQGGVMVDEPDSSISPEKDDPEITVKPETPDTSSTPETGNSGSGAVASGTEQTIQGDPEKPEYDDEALKDPTQKPDGTPVEGKPDAEDHDTVEPPPPPPSTNTSGGLPGFDNVPNGGANHVTEADDMYENGNKIGIMG